MRDANRRTKKYKAKLDGTVSQLRLKKYGKNQKNRFRAAVIKQIGIERTVKSLVSGSAPSMLLHFYCNFGKKVVQLMRKHKGANLMNELLILDNIWSTRGLDTTLLGNIKTHFVPGYAAPPPPPVCDWLHKMKLTFSGNVSATDLDDFPVLVHLTNANFDFTHARPSGQDLRFMDSDSCPDVDTPLKHEIEHWDSVGEEAWIWVKVPRINTGIADFIYMYFDNNVAPDIQDAPNVWDNNFMMVQHMFDDPDNQSIEDSTGYNNDGTKILPAQPTEWDSPIYKGQLFDGSNDEVTILDSPELRLVDSDGTIEYWVDHSATAPHTFPGIYWKWAGGSGWRGGEGRDNDSLWHVVDGIAAFGTNGILPDGVWAYVTITWDGTNCRMYVNGNLTDTLAMADRPNLNTSNLTLGNETGASRRFKGKLDEFRVSDMRRISDWIKAQHLSMTDALITYGAEE